MKAADGPDDLDNAHKIKFSKKVVATNREFFDLVNTTTRSSIPQSTVHEHASAFHLLSHFEMEFCVSGNTCAAALERLLRHYAPDLAVRGKSPAGRVAGAMGADARRTNAGHAKA